jgi:hypothetical protein
MEVQRHTCLNSEVDGGEWPASCPGRFTPSQFSDINFNIILSFTPHFTPVDVITLNNTL